MQSQFFPHIARFSGLCLLALFLLCLLTGSQFADPASAGQRPSSYGRLRTVKVTFKTTDDDKDADTKLSIYVYRSGNILTAKKENLEGYYGDNTPMTVDLEVLYPATFNEILGGNLKIRIAPNGHDTWRFNCIIDLAFTDGTYRKEFNGNSLNERETEKTFALN